MLATLLIGAPNWVLPAGLAALLILLLATRGYWQAQASLVTKSVALLLKIAGVLLLAICLIEPLFSGVRPRPGANLFVVLTDNSRSMTAQSGSRVRDDGVREILDRKSGWRARLEQDFDVRDYMFDDQLKHLADPSEIALNGTSSAMHTALDTLATRFQQRPVAGVLLLSDGNATDAPANAEFPFPVYPLVDQDSAVIRDLRIESMTVTETNFQASPVTVKATIVADGFRGEGIVVRIVNQQGMLLREQQQTVQGNQPLEFRFRFRPEQPGLSFHRLEVCLESQREQFDAGEAAAELTLANNTRWISVDRGGGPFRVLYIAGRPNWEFKFLRRALQGDEEVNLTGLLRIAKKQPKFSFRDRTGVSDRNQLFEGFDGVDDEDAETYDQPVLIRLGVERSDELRDGFPKDAEELFQYHAVILDDLEAKFFSADQMLLLRRFVNARGGGLMMLGGQESFVGGDYDKTTLGELLPVYLGRSDKSPELEYRWNLTREGRLQDWMRLRTTLGAEDRLLEELPGFLTINGVGGLKPGASLLAAAQPPAGQAVPALATQRFGKGRSAALLIGDLWRWGMHRRDPRQDDLQQLWRQIVRWLVADVPQRVEVASRQLGAVGTRQLEMTVRDAEFQPHDNADVRVAVTTPGGEVIELTAEASDREAGVYVANFFPKEEGPYRAAAEVTTADGEVLDRKEAGWTCETDAAEFRDPTTNKTALAELARRSGGELISPDELDEFVASLPNRKVPVTETWVYPLWHQPWVLALAIGCLCGEWGIRRLRGLA